MAATALEPVVQYDPGGLATFAGAGAIAEEPAATKANGSLGLGRDCFQIVECGIDGPVSGKIAGMRFAGIDHAFELGIGEVAAGDGMLRQMRTVARFRWRDRRHGDGFDKPVRVWCRAWNMNCLQPIWLVDAVGDIDAGFWRCLAQFVV